MILKFIKIERNVDLLIEPMRLIMCITFLILSSVSFCQITKGKLSNDSLVNKNVNEDFELTFHYFLDGECNWYLESNDSTRIKLISITHDSPKEVNDTLGKVRLVFPGGGFDEIWKFIGIQKGVYQLRFHYKCKQQNEIRRNKNVKVIIS
jgi:predicted secreted protein